MSQPSRLEWASTYAIDQNALSIHTHSYLSSLPLLCAGNAIYTSSLGTARGGAVRSWEGGQGEGCADLALGRHVDFQMKSSRELPSCRQGNQERAAGCDTA